MITRTEELDQLQSERTRVDIQKYASLIWHSYIVLSSSLNIHENIFAF